jgi:AcrR family transcriptional regulator
MGPISRRASAALETRRRVVEAAHRSFLERGYSATTIKDVAVRAGVSPETIYKGFGSKANLLKTAYDVAMAGDHDPVSIAERPEGRAALEATTPAAAAAAYADLAELLVARAGPLTRIVLASRGANDEVEGFATTIDSERLEGAAAAVRHWADRGWLRPGVDVDRARDILWVLTSPHVYTMTLERGWSTRVYRDWLADAVLSQVLVTDQ